MNGKRIPRGPRADTPTEAGVMAAFVKSAVHRIPLNEAFARVFDGVTKPEWHPTGDEGVYAVGIKRTKKSVEVSTERVDRIAVK